MSFEEQSDTAPHIATSAKADSGEDAAPIASPNGDNRYAPFSDESTAPEADTSAELRQLMEEVRALHRDLQARFLLDDTKQRQLDTMHTELQEHRRGMHYQLLRPVFSDLIAMLDGMVSVTARLAREQGGNGTSSQSAILDRFREQIEETLRRNGVESYTGSDGVFDRERQRAIGIVETSDPTLDKRVAESVRPGYVYDGRIVVQAEQVKTYRYMPLADPPAPPSLERSSPS